MKARDRLPKVLTAPLERLQLVEASAGTGKTWTISGLYLRLLVERPADVPAAAPPPGVDRILAVTFTRAATAELRERILARIRGLHDLLEGRPCKDHLCKLVHDTIAPEHLADARRRLDLALRAFDESAIQTIHSFCQRALADHAFSSGGAFACEIAPDTNELLHEVCADYWRRALSSTEIAVEPAHQRLLVDWLTQRRVTLVELEKFAKNWLGRTGMTVHPPAPTANLDEAIDAFLQLWQQCGDALRKDRNGLQSLLAEDPALFRKIYRDNWLRKWFDDSVRWLAKEPALLNKDAIETLSRFAQDRVDGQARPGQQAPQREFFAFAGALVEANATLDKALRRWWREQRLALLDWARAELDKRLAQANLQSYDDLLRKLGAALAGPRGDVLAQSLRERYPYALIDEFQDTDPLQWQILERIYGEPRPGSALFLVGDRKQSIYSFRGADIHAYLAAAGRCDAPIDLQENQRSVPGLVEAVNQVFDSGRLQRGPFRHEQIPFHPAEHSARGARTRLVENGKVDEAPLRILMCGEAPDGKPRSKPDGMAWAADAVAREIAHLIGLAGARKLVLRTELDEAEAAAMAAAGEPAGDPEHDPLQSQDSPAPAKGSLQAGAAEWPAVAQPPPPSPETLQGSLFGDLPPAGKLRRSAPVARAAGNARYRNVPLPPGEIAVLVSTNKQATLVRRKLAELGIASAELSTQSVFQTGTAEQLERLLIAIAHPRDLGSVRAALLGELLGWTAPQLEAAERSPQWDATLDRFERWHRTWQERGLMRMLREMIQEAGVAVRLAQYIDGERRLTDLYHLAELLHAEYEQRHGMDPLLGWLATRRASGAGEETQLRLESDEKLVKIATVHKAKGLEYAVTFVPFLWDAWGGDEDIVLYHERTPPYAAILDAGSDNFEAAQALYDEEQHCEKLRVAYVALTRAKNRCYVYTGLFNGVELSAAGWLLHELDPVEDSGKGKFLKHAGLQKQVEALAAASEGEVRIDAVRDDGSQQSLDMRTPPPPMDAQPFAQHIPRGHALTSFTALLHGIERPAPEAEADHDEQAPQAASFPVEPGGGRFAFPRGVAAGVRLHTMLEDLDHGDRGGWEAPLLEILAEDRPEQRAWYPALAEWLHEVVTTPLPDPLAAGAAAVAAGAAVQAPDAAAHAPAQPPLTLAQLPAAQQRRELEFHLALDGFQPAAIAALAERHGVPVSRLAGERLQGYLTGFVDLVYVHDGRWHVADYKSNWLGGSPADYGAAPLAHAMQAGDYHLQYLLYTVALHRWLGRSLPGYDYDAHFGGVQYLFLRGMHPHWRDANGAPLGVYTTRPARALVEALDAALGGSVPRAGPGGAGSARTPRTPGEAA